MASTIDANTIDVTGELEALIEEARNRQRRRRRRVALAVFVTVAAGFGAVALGGGGASRPPAVVAASPGAIGAFLARAEQALDGKFSATYEVTVARAVGPARRAEVIAAQLSQGRTFYREMPSYSAGSPSFTAQSAKHGYEVFSGPNDDPRGIFSCARTRSISPWSCVGPFVGIGMGGTLALQGPYPPRALVLGLENARAIYTGKMATRPEPAFLTRRRLDGQDARCLQFGELRRPLGSVCLNPVGLIASYQLPPAVTYSTYNTATLQAFVANAKRGTFSLPAPARGVGN